jgi:hypothetical protein
MKNSKGAAQNSIKKRALAVSSFDSVPCQKGFLNVRLSIKTLKRKKMYEQQRDQMAAQSFNIEQVWNRVLAVPMLSFA